MVWSFLTGRRKTTSYQPAKQQFSISTSHSDSTSLTWSSQPENNLQEDIHKLRLDASSTSSFGADGRYHSKFGKEPLDAVTLSSVTSPGFTSRLAQRSQTVSNPLRENNASLLNGHSLSFQIPSPVSHNQLKLGQLPSSTWKHHHQQQKPPTFLSPVNTARFSLTRRKKPLSSSSSADVVPGTTFIPVAPIDIVNKSTNTDITTVNGNLHNGSFQKLPANNNSRLFNNSEQNEGSSVIGTVAGVGEYLSSTASNIMQKIWPQTITIDEEASSSNSSNGGIYRVNVKVNNNRKRNRIPDNTFENNISMSQGRVSLVALDDPNSKQNPKRTKYVQFSRDLRNSTLPNLPSQTGREILSLDGNDSTKASMVNTQNKPATNGMIETGSTSRKRRASSQPAITSIDEEEEGEGSKGSRGFCSCSECYNEAAGINTSIVKEIVKDDLQPAKKKKKSVSFNQNLSTAYSPVSSNKKHDDIPEEEDDTEKQDEQKQIEANSISKSRITLFPRHGHIITKQAYEIDKQRRLDRLNRILNESYRRAKSSPPTMSSPAPVAAEETKVTSSNTLNLNTDTSSSCSMDVADGKFTQGVSSGDTTIATTSTTTTTTTTELASSTPAATTSPSFFGFGSGSTMTKSTTPAITEANTVENSSIQFGFGAAATPSSSSAAPTNTTFSTTITPSTSIFNSSFDTAQKSTVHKTKGEFQVTRTHESSSASRTTIITGMKEVSNETVKDILSNTSASTINNNEGISAFVFGKPSEVATTTASDSATKTDALSVSSTPNVSNSMSSNSSIQPSSGFSFNFGQQNDKGPSTTTTTTTSTTNNAAASSFPSINLTSSSVPNLSSNAVTTTSTSSTNLAPAVTSSSIFGQDTSNNKLPSLFLQGSTSTAANAPNSFFGQQQQQNSPSNATVTTTNSGGMPFGNVFGTQPSTQPSSTTTPGSGGFSFTSSTPATSNFGQATTATTLASSTFGQGITTNPTFGQSTTNTNTTANQNVPQFGSNELNKSGVFTFGKPAESSTPSTTTNSSGVFTFGQPNLTSNSAGATGATITSPFGGSTNATPSVPSIFAFGQGATTSSAPAFGQNVPNNSAPAFGQNAANNNSAPAFGQNAANTSTPAFGSNTGTSNNFVNGVTPGFGSSSTGTSGNAFGQMNSGFGQANVPSTPFGGTSTTNTSIQPFGQSQPSSFPSFGQQSAAPAAAPSAGFNFSSAAANVSGGMNSPFGGGNVGFGGGMTPQVNGGALPPINLNFGAAAGNAASPAKSPVFQFGQQQQQQQQPSAQGGFNFGAAAQQQPSMFSIGASSATPSSRPHARARRRRP